MLDVVRTRVNSLVVQHNPLDISLIPNMYSDEYYSTLDYQNLGFTQLRAFLESIPEIQVRKGTLKGKKGKSRSCLIAEPRQSVSADKGKHSKKRVSDKSCVTSDFTPETSPESTVEPLPAASFFEFASKSNTASLPKDSQASEGESIACDTSDILSILKPDISFSMSPSQACLGDEETASQFEERAYLGCRHPPEDEPIYLNTHQPFCLATIGVQGAGKSHTLSCVLESCLLYNAPQEAIRLKNPMTALVLHYDQSTTSICEAAGLLTPSPNLPAGYSKAAVPREKATILVSPTFYKQRKDFYGDYCNVRPLLFRWKSLTADHIKRIMGIKSSDNQLYVSSFMTLLRRYQRQAVIPSFSNFIKEVTKSCNAQGQTAPLGQRIALLESVIAESSVNTDIAAQSMDIGQAMAAELDLIIVDLTDPLLAKDDANGLFQVVTEQFRSSHAKGGKLLALDEVRNPLIPQPWQHLCQLIVQTNVSHVYKAHKFMEGTKTDGLSEAIINVARLMRHDGIRLVVSTQSPKALAPEVLELVSVAVLHHFHSQDWCTYIRQKLPLPDQDWN